MASDAHLVSRIPEIVHGLEERAAAIVHKTALDIEAGAKARSRVDTGQMKNGWQTSEKGPLEVEVGNPVEHTIYNEYGTRHMSAQPMLGPSVEEASHGFAAAFRRLFE